jgi:hypothetical protein
VGCRIAVTLATAPLFLIVSSFPGDEPSGFAQSPQKKCALELVLTVDVSGSVDDYNFGLQMQGYAAAFRDPEVQQVIALLNPGDLVVTLMQWSSSHEQEQSVGWTRVRTPASLEAFAGDRARGRSDCFQRAGMRPPDNRSLG